MKQCQYVKARKRCLSPSTVRVYYDNIFVGEVCGKHAEQFKGKHYSLRLKRAANSALVSGRKRK